MKRAGPSPLEVYKLSEIPLSSFEAAVSRNGNAFRRQTPAEYYRCAEKFHEAISRGSDPWSVSLTGKDGFPVEVIHETACIMRQIRGPRSANAFATALWASASEAGYRPSTLSLARHLARSGAYGRVPPLRKVEARFKQLVSTARDADALTVEGELQYEQGNYEAAIRALQRALQVGGGEEEAFEWKPYCELCMGKALVKLGRRDEARAILEALSAAGGLVEADVELGNLLRVSDRDAAERHLIAAASNGRADMFSVLSEIALEKAAESGDDKAAREESLRWAKEWSKLGDPRTEY
ncbi:hypothetical protein BBK36DRAFT_1116125 [Trichoderma citrinoviride]|uniref:Uncharacterized protein n=1 Tax=Trichoderma citrinoviride TaxID=58853 RepID=A0A2T4BD99_9HYPO|nr:hypothetical protein BBK36DRAFT_1116125 [Trichoderma citrinoviride]PTB67310.1 hypothetical protein BBK36DRAFT_1116125 [Trichoderma citrinoviride]